jgi:hypothetical protein
MQDNQENLIYDDEDLEYIDNSNQVNYSEPQNKEIAVDQESGETIDLDSLSHWEKIQLAAKDAGLKDISAKSSCKKCYGRGYVGLWYIKNPDGTETRMPNACSCIYNKQDKKAFRPEYHMNRIARRNYERNKEKIQAEQNRIIKKQMKLSDNAKVVNVDDMEVETINI